MPPPRIPLAAPSAFDTDQIKETQKSVHYQEGKPDKIYNPDTDEYVTLVVLWV